jgi:hypothetical protein
MRGTSDKHKELQEIIREFRDDEMQHHDIGIENDAEKVQRLGWRGGGGWLEHALVVSWQALYIPDTGCLSDLWPVARSGVAVTQLLCFRYHTKIC